MKKLLSSLLAAIMLLALCSTAFAATDLNTLVVGTPAMNGDFIDGFGNSAYDANIKRILRGQIATVVPNVYDELIIHPLVVKDYTAEVDEAGNKTYTWTIFDDLKWSDGEPMTAKDFVFSELYQTSPEWIEAGAAYSGGDGLLGYDAYKAGETKVHAGLHLIDDYTFSVTINAEQLPYFHELSFASVTPQPLHVYGPELEIKSDETGSWIEGDLLAALQNVAATERFAPTVSCGPYKFVSFENQTVTLEINDLYKGDPNGLKPQIQYIVQKYIPSETDVDEVIAGDVDLVTGVIEGKKIEAAKASTTAKTRSYFRNGYGYLAMHVDWGVTADENVRWAIAYLLDRNEVIDYVLGGYGGTVQSQYGFAQWMYEEAGADLEEELVAYNLNVEKANELLDETEWKFEADGKTPFDATKANAEGTYMRYNDKGEMLTIHHMGSTGNDVTAIIEIQYTANAPLAGMKFEVTQADFNALLDNYYYGFQKGADRFYNTFNLAVTFGRPFDPYYNWHSDFIETYANSCQVDDEELDQYIDEMRKLEPTQKEEYIEAWLKFEKRFQEIMAQIPLYSNEYYEVMGMNVEGVNTTSFASWDYVVCEIYKTAE